MASKAARKRATEHAAKQVEKGVQVSRQIKGCAIQREDNGQWYAGTQDHEPRFVADQNHAAVYRRRGDATKRAKGLRQGGGKSQHMPVPVKVRPI